MMAYPKMKDIDIAAESESSMRKAYNIRAGKGQMGAPTYGVSSATADIIEAILNNLKVVMPVSVRVPGRRCVLSSVDALSSECRGLLPRFVSVQGDVCLFYFH